jgi:hypothetical protein
VFARKQRNRAVTIVRLVCAGVALAAAIRPALAQEPPTSAPPAPVTLVDPESVPFSSAELAQALLARFFASEEASQPRIRIAPASVGAVVVEAGDRRRVVSLAERTGPAAARVVALVIVELLSDAAHDGESNDAGDEPTSPAVNVSPDSKGVPAAALVAVPSPAPSGSALPTRLCVTGGMTRGTGKEELLAYAADADLILPIQYGGVRLAPSAGFVFMPTRNAGNWHEVSYKAGTARLLGGTSLGPVDLFGGPIATGYSIGGINPHAGIVFGAEALARVSVPLSRNARLALAARANYYVDRVRVLFADGTGYATPRFELSLGLGLSWEWPS